ncbi:MAG: ferrichrome ABC transporter permease [Pirellulaceae bacterium]|nr:MAG: ferrichrome ABC transporter permease [Pirellulaceae bacterium]
MLTEILRRLRHRRLSTVLAPVIVAAVVMPLGICAFLLIGDVAIDARTAYEALFQHDANIAAHVIVRDWRLPRAIADLLIGASLAVAGTIMQTMTRNPLASPGIMGLNSGANFATIAALILVPSLGRPGLLLVAIAGAASGAALVYGLGSLSRGGLTPVRLALTGVAVSTLLGSFSKGVMIYFELGEDLLLWESRGTLNIQWEDVMLYLPFFLAGLTGSLAIAPALNVLELGAQVAQGLGQQTWLVNLWGGLVVLLLAGGSVAAAGAIGFVGLMIPHVVRLVVGHDHRVVIPTAALAGGAFLLIADIGARIVTTPYRAAVPVGVVTSILGVPFFLYLALRRQKSNPGGRP